MLTSVAEKPLEPVYLLTGGDRPKVRRALSRLRARFDAESVERLSAETVSGEEAVAACNALGLFGGDRGRLVVVENVERWKAEDVAAVEAYLSEPAPGSVLALVAEEKLRGPKLAQAVSGAGQLLAYEAPKPRDLPAWVRERLQSAGVQADQGAAQALVEIVGDDLAALSTEADKIADWSQGQEVTRREVEQLAVPASEAAAWAITDAWGDRDLPRALAACESDLHQGGEPFLVAVRLASQVALVRSVQSLAAEGMSVKEMARRLRKRHEFPVRKALGHAENYSPDELDAAVVRLAALDEALKGASRLSGELELERALTELIPTSAGTPA
jgi:DNA polymerase III subunit delta